MHPSKYLITIIAATLLTGCIRASTANQHNHMQQLLAPGVSYKLAQTRSKQLEAIHYDIYIAIPKSLDESIHATTTVEFERILSEDPLILDFKADPKKIRNFSVNDQPIKEIDYQNQHLVIGTEYLEPGKNNITLSYEVDKLALNREAGVREDYVYTTFLPDFASRVFPCFDQPDLKATAKITLDLPSDWVAVSNGPAVADPVPVVESGSEATAAKRHVFSMRKPISTYLFAFAAGAFKTASFPMTLAGKEEEITLYYYEGPEEKLTEEQRALKNRNLREISDEHQTRVRLFEDSTRIAFPFAKLDAVMIPGFQYAGFENVGAIFYLAKNLLLDAAATQKSKDGRAQSIAHEVFHQWFGDLVTIPWFSEVWFKEAPTNFVVKELFKNKDKNKTENPNQRIYFLLRQLSSVYAADSSDGPESIACPLENLRDVGLCYSVYGYFKIPFIFPWLKERVGAEEFDQGIIRYLTQYKYANAGWHEFLDSLDPKKEYDLAAWSKGWIHQAGRPYVHSKLKNNGKGKIETLTIHQRDPKGEGRLWPQPLVVGLGYDKKEQGVVIREQPVMLETTSAQVKDSAGQDVPDFILINSDSQGYGYFELSQQSRDFLLRHVHRIQDDIQRAIAWLTLWDNFLESADQDKNHPDYSHFDAKSFVDAAMYSIDHKKGHETNGHIIHFLSSCIYKLFWLFFSEQTQAEYAKKLETLFWQEMQQSSDATLKNAYFKWWRQLVFSASGREHMQAVFDEIVQQSAAGKEPEVAGLPALPHRVRLGLALELAVRIDDPKDNTKILNQTESILAGSKELKEFQFVREAVAADEETRIAFFTGLSANEGARLRENRWVRRAIPYLHHPLRAEASTDLIPQALDMMDELFYSGVNVFYPWHWAIDTLRGHSSAAAAQKVRDFVRQKQQHPDENFPDVLVKRILQAGDTLFRAAAYKQQ